MGKSPDAFRTISEVADWLGIQAHVLRFWESKFTQVKPIKRAGGRRYYRPNDMLLLGGIRQLLHEDGLTIKGVQKILREEGIGHVSAMSQPLDEETQSQVEDTAQEAPMIEVEPEQESAVVVNFDGSATTEDTVIETSTEEKSPQASLPFDEPVTKAEPKVDAKPVEVTPEAEETVAAEAEEPVEVDTPASQADVEETQTESVEDQAAEATSDAPPAAAALPAFLRRPAADAGDEAETPPQVETETASEPEQALEAEPAPKPRIIDMPPLTPVDQIAAAPALLTTAFRTSGLSTAQASQIAPLLDRLTVLRDSMAAQRNSGPNA